MRGTVKEACMHFNSQAEYLRFLRSAPVEPEKYKEKREPAAEEPVKQEPEAKKKRGKKA